MAFRCVQSVIGADLTWTTPLIMSLFLVAQPGLAQPDRCYPGLDCPGDIGSPQAPVNPPPTTKPPGTGTKLEEGGIKIVKCRIGSSEVTIEDPRRWRLGSSKIEVTAGGTTGGQYDNIWGVAYMNKDDSVCPAIMARAYGKKDEYGINYRLCISPVGIIYVPFSGARVGDCKICNAVGNCFALQLP